MIEPENFGPGKIITPEQSVEYAKANWQKFIMMLMLRMGVEEVVLDEADMTALLAKMQSKNGLGIKLSEAGVHLMLVGSGFGGTAQ